MAPSGTSGLVRVLPTQLTEPVHVVVRVVPVLVVLGSLRALEAVGTAVVTHHKRVRVPGSKVEAVVVAGIAGTCGGRVEL